MLAVLWEQHRDAQDIFRNLGRKENYLTRFFVSFFPLTLFIKRELRVEEVHTYKREKYRNLTKDLGDAGYKDVVMPANVVARGLIGSGVYDLVIKL